MTNQTPFVSIEAIQRNLRDLEMHQALRSLAAGCTVIIGLPPNPDRFTQYDERDVEWMRPLGLLEFRDAHDFGVPPLASVARDYAQRLQEEQERLILTGMYSRGCLSFDLLREM